MKRSVRYCNLLAVCLFLSLLSVTVAGAQSPPERGKTLYMTKCASCHGEKGKGDGPFSASLPAKSTNFNDSKFWRGDAAKLITDAIQKGKGIMPSISMKPDEIKDVTNYMTRTFKPVR
jgi:mono/diheme cytochrome c family protein